jgi:tRNA 2-thiouridine synthesizing protein A
MGATARGRDGELGAFARSRSVQALNEIRRQEGTIARDADDPSLVTLLRGGPIQRREYPGERPNKSLYAVGDDGQAKGCKPRRFAIGVEDEAVTLWGEPRGHPLKDSKPADHAHRLVTPADAAGKTTRQDDPKRWDAVIHFGVAQYEDRRLTRPDPFRIVNIMAMTKLDLIGLNCPLPALKTRKALLRLAPGDFLQVHCTDPLAAIDIPNLVRETGDRIENAEHTECRIVFLIEKAG